MAIAGIYHVNINVTDMDRSLAFYRKLGFAVRGPANFSGPESVREGLRIPDGAGRVATLTIGSAQGTPVLDLIQWTSPPTHGEPYADLAHAGIVRIAFETHQLRATYAQLKAAGVPFWSEPQILRTGHGVTLYVCFPDPDGTVLELIEHLGPDDDE